MDFFFFFFIRKLKIFAQQQINCAECFDFTAVLLYCALSALSVVPAPRSSAGEAVTCSLLSLCLAPVSVFWGDKRDKRDKREFSKREFTRKIILEGSVKRDDRGRGLGRLCSTFVDKRKKFVYSPGTTAVLRILDVIYYTKVCV